MTRTFEYDIELDKIKIEKDDKSRDNIEVLQRSLQQIQVIINDIDRRLNELE